MKAYWPYNLTESFVDAVNVWSEFLKGERTSKEWGVAAAARFLNDAGFGTFSEAISADTLRKLKVLAAGAGELANPTPRQMKRVSAFEALASEVSPFFEKNCDVKLEPDLASTTFKKSQWLGKDTDDLEDVTKVIKNEYDQPGDALDAVDVQAKNLYDSVPADTANNYDKVPTEATKADLPAEEYDVLGRDLIDSPYFEPPPPESYFESIQPDGAP